MGYTVLYIAFGVVALWLLGEVLLQYKARLRWRVLAFVGFLGVVAGVVLPQVIVIILGAAAFGTGQTFVTLSYRRGFTTGWALGGAGSSRRRKDAAAAAKPSLAVSDVEAADGTTAEASADTQGFSEGFPVQEPVEYASYGTGYEQQYTEAAAPPVYSPEPLHEDTGEYGIYGDQSAYAAAAASASYNGGYEGYAAQGYGTTEWQPEWQHAEAYQPQGYGGYGYEQQQSYPEQQSYPDYQEQYQDYGSHQGYDAYQQQPHGEQGYAYDPYAQQPGQAAYGYDAPPEGAWAPPQPDYGEHAYIPQQAPPMHDQPQPQHTDPYNPYGY